MTKIQTAAVLLDGETIQQWMCSAVAGLVEESGVDVDLIVVNSRRKEEAGTKSRFETLRNLSAWNIYRAYRRRKGEIPEKSVLTLDQVGWASDTRRMFVSPKPANGFGNKLTKDAVVAIGEQDIAIRFGFGVLKGNVLSAPKYGVLSYHGGELSKYRGRPAGFWEFLHQEEEVGITVQRLSETLDGGEIAAEDTVNIRDATSWPVVQQRLLSSMGPLLSTAIENLEDPNVEVKSPEILGDIYTNPNMLTVVKYIILVGIRTARKILLELD